MAFDSSDLFITLYLLVAVKLVGLGSSQLLSQAFHLLLDLLIVLLKLYRNGLGCNLLQVRNLLADGVREASDGPDALLETMINQDHRQNFRMERCVRLNQLEARGVFFESH